VPIDASRLTAFIDVQGSLLFWTACAWTDDFTGYVVGYGAWPDQQRPYFTLREARETLVTATKIGSLEGSIYAALDRLTKEILGREWKREDGAALRIERCLIDANWGSSTDVVYQFCRQSGFSGVVMPSHGRFVGASSPAFDQYRRKPGERIGHNWRIPNVRGTRAVRHLVYDTNFWKSFVHARLAAPMGEKGCLSLYGDKPGPHRLYADHLTAEYPVKTEAKGRVVDEWKVRSARPDNHWFDCTVGCAVGASLQGCALAGVTQAVVPLKPKRVSFAEMQQRRRRA
jgi:phage terminase large subunit GpA-like protein